MKKLLLLLCIILFSISIRAQVWCPPGASWQYRIKNLYMPYENGWVTMTFNGTLTVNGKTCQDISGQRWGVMYFGGTAPLTGVSSVITSYNNGVLERYRSVQNVFDTVANFNANIGDGWYVSGWDSSCLKFNQQRIKSVVVDTGHIVINGFNLKRISLMSGSTFTYNVIERIGSLYGFFFPAYYCQFDGGDFHNFSCYWDNSFPVYSLSNQCNLVGLEKSNDNFVAGPYPNPAAGLFTIRVKSDTKLRVFSATGTLVYEHFIKDATEFKLDLSERANGIYYLQTESLSGSQNFKLCKD